MEKKEILTSKDKSITNLIIEILSSEFPLKLKEIHNRVKKSGKKSSMQAVYKTLKQLQEKNITQKENKLYKLNFKWIEIQENYFKRVKKEYTKTNQVEIIREKVKEMQRKLENGTKI